MRSKARKEEAVWKQLRESGLEVYYPRLRVRPVNPRSRTSKAYFPGYLFVRADLEVSGVSMFQWMPHTFGLVMYGGEPAPIPDHLIAALRQRVEEITVQEADALAGVRPGDTVQINLGPFKGFEAIFDVRLSGSERVKVLLKFLDSRRVPVELPTSYIKPTGERS